LTAFAFTAPTMEAVGVVASILGISSFALELTKTLYEFGDTVTSAKEETHKIAKNISNYSGVLDLLQESLRNNEPLYTQRALKLADSLSKQSQTIFREIREIVPGSPPWDGFKWREKTRWAFRKSKVNALVGEIEHLKSTLNLLLQTMIFARQTYLAQDKDKRYTIRAEQALYEQFNASERLSMLQKQQIEEEQAAGAMGKSSSTTSSRGALVAYKDPVLSAFQHEYLTSNASSKDKAARLRGDSSLWLDQMKAEWFDAKEAESHLSLQLVKEDLGSSSGSRKEDGPKMRELKQMREEFEKGLRELKQMREEDEKEMRELKQTREEDEKEMREKDEKEMREEDEKEMREEYEEQIRELSERLQRLAESYEEANEKYTRLQAEHSRMDQAYREDRDRMVQAYQEELRLMMQRIQEMQQELDRRR
jgi:hypothetical protein